MQRHICALLLTASSGLLFLDGCHQRPAENNSANPEMAANGADKNKANDESDGHRSAVDPPELEDGAYDCEATNDTRGEGSYDLECEKSGDELTIHFNNGGFIVTTITSTDQTDNTWTIEATNDEDAEVWEVTITK